MVTIEVYSYRVLESCDVGRCKIELEPTTDNEYVLEKQLEYLLDSFGKESFEFILAGMGYIPKAMRMDLTWCTMCGWMMRGGVGCACGRKDITCFQA